MGQENRTKTKPEEEKENKPPSSIACAGQSLTRGDSHLFLPASSQSKQNSTPFSRGPDRFETALSCGLDLIVRTVSPRTPPHVDP